MRRRSKNFPAGRRCSLDAFDRLCKDGLGEIAGTAQVRGEIEGADDRTVHALDRENLLGIGDAECRFDDD